MIREASEGVPVGQPPVEDVVALAASRRRRRTRWTVGGVVLAVAAVGLGTWVGTRPPDDDLPAVTVLDETNPANIDWYAGGVLHLRDVAVEMPRVTQLVQVPDGVVVTDQSGRVIQVDPEGTLTRLGSAALGSRMASSQERGWVAWVEPGDDPDLVVHDTVTRHELASIPVEADSSPIAIDRARLYYDEDGETWSWQLPDFEPVRVTGADYLDVGASVRVRTAAPGFVEVMEPLRDAHVAVPGTDATLSSDGVYLLTHLDQDTPSSLQIFEVATGRPVASGVADDGGVTLAAAFGPDNTITYVVGSGEHGTDGDERVRLSELRPLELRTCDLLVRECQTVLRARQRLRPPDPPARTEVGGVTVRGAPGRVASKPGGEGKARTRRLSLRGPE